MIHTTMQPNLAQKIFRLRKARKWTQARLAAESGVSQQLVSAIEKGYIPHPRSIHKLAIALRTDPIEMLT